MTLSQPSVGIAASLQHTPATGRIIVAGTALTRSEALALADRIRRAVDELDDCLAKLKAAA